MAIVLTEAETNEAIAALERVAGPSNAEAGDAILAAFGDWDTLIKVARTWAAKQEVSAASEADMFVAFAVAVELGYRIALKRAVA